MTSTPFPIFQSTHPTERGKALSVVGQCRVYPENCLSTSASEIKPFRYPHIVAKCQEQAQAAALPAPDEETKKSNKQLQKKYMKQGVALASQLLSEGLHLDCSVIDVEVVVETTGDLIKTEGLLASCFLDAGAARIVVIVDLDEEESWEEVEKAMDLARIPRERIVLHAELAKTGETCEWDEAKKKRVLELLTRASQFTSRISVTEEVLAALVEKQTEAASLEASCIASFLDLLEQQVATTTDNQDWSSVEVVVQLNPQDDENFATHVGTLPSSVKSTPTPPTASTSTPYKRRSLTLALLDPTPTQLGQAYAACITTDRPDKLYTTVVCTRTGVALGLVYSSITSVVASLECGRAVYYSRSRQGLWRKGDTSGHFQILHRFDVDCDGDALRATVTQCTPTDEESPAFCHLHTLTCWGEPRGLEGLQQVLQERKRAAPPGSYTQRLFQDEELLRNKLVEEAQELSEAETHQHVAEEMADVIYFAMVRAAKAGVTLGDVVKELDKRARKVTRRKGDSKAFRIEQGDKILNKE